MLRQLHLTTGLIAGIVIVALGLSGSALMFRANLERWLVRDWLSPAPIDRLRSVDELFPAFLMASGSWLWWRRRRATRAPV